MDLLDAAGSSARTTHRPCDSHDLPMSRDGPRIEVQLDSLDIFEARRSDGHRFGCCCCCCCWILSEKRLVLFFVFCPVLFIVRQVGY